MIQLGIYGRENEREKIGHSGIAGLNKFFPFYGWRIHRETPRFANVMENGKGFPPFSSKP